MSWFARLRGLHRPATTLADQAVVSVANFATVLFFARGLPAAEFGLVALMLTILLAINAVQTALVGQVHNLLGARREGDSLETLTGHLLVVQFALSGLILIPASLVGAVLYSTGGWASAKFVLETTILLAPWLFQDTIRRFLYTKRHMTHVFFNDAVTYGVQLFGAAAVLSGRLPATFESALSVYLAATILGSVVGIPQLRQFGVQFDRATFRTDIRAIWGVGRYLAAGEVLGIIGRNATSWLLAAVMGLPALGAYRAVTHLANMLNPLSIASGLYLPALTSARWSETSPAAYRAWFGRLTAALSGAMGLVVAVLCLGAGSLIDVAYGTRFDAFPVVALLEIALIGRLLMFSHDTLFHGLVGAGASRAVLLDRGLQLVILVVAGVPFVTEWGILGAALWHLLSAVLLTSFAIYRFRQLGHIPSHHRPAVLPPGTIGFGAESIVVADESTGTVQKRFLQPDRARSRALAEYRMLDRMRAAADRAPMGIRSPRPVAFLHDENIIVMEHCPGQPLDDYLWNSRPDRAELRRISSALGRGLNHVIDTLEEPYHDFAPQNILWESTSGTLTVLDLGNHHVAPPGECDAGPFTVSLACFLGTTAYTAARPRRWGFMSELRRNATLFRSLAREGKDRGFRIHRRDLLRIAWHRYVEMGCSGTVERKAWYLTIGLFFAVVSAMWSVFPVMTPAKPAPSPTT